MNSHPIALLALALLLQGCQSGEVQIPSSSLPPTTTPVPSETPAKEPIGEVAYGQWNEHKSHFSGLWLVNADGSDRRIAFLWLGFTEGFAFMPNGSDMLAWTYEVEGGYLQRYILGNLETNLRGSCVTCSIDDVEYPPVPSPTGGKLAIIAYSGLYIANLDGGGVEMVIASDHIQFHWFGWPPSWSPDGRYLAVDCFVAGTSSNRIYRVRSDGTELVDLTGSHDPNEDYASPQWSPQGDRIVYVSGDKTVRTMDSDGANVSIIAQIIPYTQYWAAGTGDTPQWSPDESKLLLTTAVEMNGKADLVVINSDGTGWTNLTNTPGSDELRAQWSPDGSQIAFETDRDGNWEIYVMNADGSNPVNISQSPDTQEGSPIWRPQP